MLWQVGNAECWGLRTKGWKTRGLYSEPSRVLSSFKSNLNLYLSLEIYERNFGNHINMMMIGPKYFKTAPIKKQNQNFILIEVEAVQP